jgi:hypothetical protein
MVWLAGRAGRASERLSDRRHELVERARQDRSSRDEAEPQTVGRSRMPLEPVGFSKPPPRPIPYHASAEPAPHRKAHRPEPRLPPPEQHEGRALDARPTPEESVELRSRPEPLRSGHAQADERLPRHEASPSAGGAPWRAGASAPSGRLSSPCARGTRGSWPAGDGSVGTSASRLPPSPGPACTPCA